jgi:hypothetical protein
MDKEEVLEGLTRARAGLLAAIEDLTQVEMTTLLVTEAWTIREILAHVGGWAAWDLSAVKAIQQGNPCDLSIIQDVDVFNQRLVAERKAWSLDQILAELEETQVATHELVANLSEQDLLEVGRFQGPYWDSLAGWLRVAWEHEEEHAAQIQAWREQSFQRGQGL